MNGLPASVEAYLTDAGFSTTEILVLKRLLEGEAMTLRELGGKTGKSSGVLDQATKKLLQRKIISREIVNDTPKVVLTSLDAVVRWMQGDMQVKVKVMQSRAKDFESFISSLKQEATRPEIEYFEGAPGVEKAFMKLLSLGEKEMLCFVPATIKEEDDPLRVFRVQYFRERRKRGIFARILAQETSLGRRYQSRDAFEYRKTVLVPESVYPLNFEKIIVDGTIACFNHEAQQACFLHYPELAEAERKMFEVLWRTAPDGSSALGAVAGAPTPVPAAISLRTRISSSLREFLLSRKSLALFGLCAVLAAGITYGLYRHNYHLNVERVRERAMAIAATAAMEFDAKDIDQLHTAEDVKKPEFQKLVTHLRLIKSKNTNIKFVYIDRPTGQENPAWEVVADADYGTPDVDLNGNGIIEESEQLTTPGQKYPHADPLLQERLKTTTSDLLKDEWGEYFDSSSPIVDAQGKTVAVLFVDIDLQEARDLTNGSFKVAYFFLGFFFLFVFIRLAAFNRPLFIELLKILRSRSVLLALGGCAIVALGVTYGMYLYTLNLMKEEIGTKLMSIAATAAPEIDVKDLDQLHIAEDMKKEAYQRVFGKLNEIRDRNGNEHIIYVYVLRPTSKPNIWEFVADANSNFDIPLLSKDENNDGVINEADENAWPGVAYDATGQEFAQNALRGPFVEGFTTDQWGTFLTGMAPIYDADKQAIAVLGLDMEVSDFYQQIRNKFVPYWWFGGVFSIILILYTLFWTVNWDRRKEKIA